MQFLLSFLLVRCAVSSQYDGLVVSAETPLLGACFLCDLCGKGQFRTSCLQVLSVLHWMVCFGPLDWAAEQRREKVGT